MKGMVVKLQVRRCAMPVLVTYFKKRTPWTVSCHVCGEKNGIYSPIAQFLHLNQVFFVSKSNLITHRVYIRKEGPLNQKKSKKVQHKETTFQHVCGSQKHNLPTCETSFLKNALNLEIKLRLILK